MLRNASPSIAGIANSNNSGAKASRPYLLVFMSAILLIFMYALFFGSGNASQGHGSHANGGGGGDDASSRASSSSYFSDKVLVNAFANDPKARKALLHPAFHVPAAVKSLTDAELKHVAEAENQPPQKKGGGDDSSSSSSYFPKSMSQLRPFLEKGSAALRSKFNQIYEVEAKAAFMKVPEAFQAKVKSMFSLFPGGIGGIENQTIITVYNKYTDEYSLFNEVRRFRPGYLEKLKPEDEAEVNATYTKNAGPATCDFCSMERTAVDVFGRIESKHCYVASNVAKYEAWHSLIVSKHHNPLTFSAEILRDYFLTAQQWFEKVNSIDKEASFPFLSWDAGPRASASQIHQHMQLVLTHDRYLSKAENVRRAAKNFERRLPGKNYWEEVAAVHAQMGLALSHGANTIILSHVCPVKEREIIVITSDHTSLEFAEALNAALEALRDDVGVRAISMGVSFRTVGDIPKIRGAAPVGSSGSSYHSSAQHSAQYSSVDSEQLDRKMMMHYPTIARIIDRGSPLDRRSDTGAMEYFGANNVGADPFFIMPHLKSRLAELKKH